jgi:hypothetical protein
VASRCTWIGNYAKKVCIFFALPSIQKGNVVRRSTAQGQT